MSQAQAPATYCVEVVVQQTYHVHIRTDDPDKLENIDSEELYEIADNEPVSHTAWIETWRDNRGTRHEWHGAPDLDVTDRELATNGELVLEQ